MQCVKLRSIMGFYLNIHLNLFPVYVLLLLLTLSHGRPSARIREPRYYPKLPSSSTNNNIFSQFSNNYRSYSVNYAENMNRINNNNSSNSNLLKSRNNLYLNRYFPQNNHLLLRNEIENTEGTEEESGATGSRRSTSASNPLALVHPDFTKSMTDTKNKYRNNNFPSKTVAENQLDEISKKMSPNEEIYKSSSGQIRLISPGLVGNALVRVPRKHQNDLQEEDYDLIDKEEETLSELDFEMLTRRNKVEEKFPYFLDEMEEDETDEMDESEIDQLDNFRMKIYKELGFESEDDIKRVTRSPTTDTDFPSHNIPSTISPKWNISREEYIAAYAQYMFNVKQRKENARKNFGPRSRRKNAMTNTQMYYDYGSDHLTLESGVWTTFSFDIRMDPEFKQEGNIRIRKAVLSIPDSCRLINGSRKEFSLPQRRTNKSFSLDEMKSNEYDTMVTYDLTENVTSWMFHSDSSPFEITASCSNSHEAKNSTVTSVSPFESRRSSLRLVTSRLTIPDVLSRRRRSAQKSTLQNFKNKQSGGGRDCTKTRRGKTCCRRSLKVKFSDLGMTDVIIEPQEFDAHVCVGRCNAKRVAYSTTHAMFQHILHQTKGKKVAPRPCCTPTKLTELDVIHLDTTGTKLQVTVLKDAIVEECGCS